MRTLAALKKDLEFDKGLLSLLEVLKSVAVTQYRLLEKKITTFEKFGHTVESFFGFIAAYCKTVDHPFIHPKKKEQVVVAITSDSGLLGGINMQVVSAAVKEITATGGSLFVIGERGKVYAKETGTPFTAFGGIKDEERFGQACQVRDHVMERLLGSSLGTLKIVYPHPVSFTVQRVQTMPLLPYNMENAVFEEAVKATDIMLESEPYDIVEYLAYLLIGQKLYETFGLSRLAEFAARFVHLEESSQKLKDMDAKLQLQYFRVRHELIDRNMRELFSARLLFMSKQ